MEITLFYEVDSLVSFVGGGSEKPKSKYDYLRPDLNKPLYFSFKASCV